MVRLNGTGASTLILRMRLKDDISSATLWYFSSMNFYEVTQILRLRVWTIPQRFEHEANSEPVVRPSRRPMGQTPGRHPKGSLRRTRTETSVSPPDQLTSLGRYCVRVYLGWLLGMYVHTHTHREIRILQNPHNMAVAVAMLAPLVCPRAKPETGCDEIAWNSMTTWQSPYFPY